MNYPDHISESLETIYWALMLKFYSLMRIRDPGWKKFRSWINIPDPQLCDTHTFRIRSSVTLIHINSPKLLDTVSAVLELLLIRDWRVYGTRTYVSLLTQDFPKGS